MKILLGFYQYVVVVNDFASSAQSGEKLYKTYCAGCHGEQLKEARHQH
jgi:mono/diheme cytochrome c family protein